MDRYVEAWFPHFISDKAFLALLTMVMLYSSSVATTSKIRASACASPPLPLL